MYVDASGKPITSALEYETLWSMGAMTGIDDLDAIARLDFLCDDNGTVPYPENDLHGTFAAIRQTLEEQE